MVNKKKYFGASRVKDTLPFKLFCLKENDYNRDYHFKGLIAILHNIFVDFC